MNGIEEKCLDDFVKVLRRANNREPETLENKYPVKERYSKVTALFKILHYDEKPILFLGYNDNNDILLCSLVDSYNDREIYRFLEVVISNKTIKKFFSKEITYLDILEDANCIFIVDCSFDKTYFKSYIIEFDNIPINYRPSEKSFCPELLKENFFICSIKEKL